jgi:putative NADH-flavin reductase
MKIAVVGGGGMIGQRIVHEALDRGHHVTIVVRDPSRVAARHESLAIVEGDAVDAAGMAGHAEGHDVVVSAVGAARADNPDYALYLRAAESLITALRSVDDPAPRLVVVGGVGSLEDSSGGLLLERVPEDRRPEHLGQKAALDLYRTVTDVQWTYISPPARIEPGDRTGVYRTGETRLVADDEGRSMITMEDYAVAVIDEAEDPRHTGRRFTVGY